MSLDISLIKNMPCSVFEGNITHNLNDMAKEAGIYYQLWRPEEIPVSKASEIIGPLERGLELLKSDPERFKKLNPKNGWGSYYGLIKFVQDYIEACKKNPDAEIQVSR